MLFQDNNGFNVVTALENIILAQNLELIKNIAKVKNWDANELINQFLVIPNEKNKEKKSLKRGRGRPPGSKNITKNNVNELIIKKKKQPNKRGRGRPPGSKNKLNDDAKTMPQNNVKKRGRGRPKKRILEKVQFDSILKEEDTFSIDNFTQSSEEEDNNDNLFLAEQEINNEYEEVVCKHVKIDNEEFLHDPKTNNIYQKNHTNMFIGKLEDGKINYNTTE
jgi:hypothetical protein